MMPDLTDEQAFEIFELWEAGHSRGYISELFGIPERRIFDRTCEQRRRGTLAHPSLKDLPNHQGRGGGRPWGKVDDPAEIEARTAEIRAMKKLHGNE